MDEPPLRAVVIGSGIGGSAATLLLQHAGIPTVLVEKNRRIGGSCSAYDKDGFHVDIGTHMFSRGPRGPLGDVLRRTGHDGAIRFVRTPDIAEVRFRLHAAPGGTGRPRARGDGDLVCVPVPAEAWRMPRFAWEMCRALRLTPRQAVRAARIFGHILSMSDAEVAGWQGRTVEEYLAPFGGDPRVVGVFGFLLGLYFILPYWQVSAGEALWSFRAMARDNFLSYPLGGAIAVPATYVRLARRLGADVRTGTGVRRVAIEGGRVRGVELDDGTMLPAAIVVSTSSLRTTALGLCGARHFPEAWVDRVRRIRGSFVAVQAKIALRTRLVSAGALVGGVGDGVDLFDLSTSDLRRMFGQVAEGRVPDVVPFYCPIPTNFDPSLAPPGCQLLTVCAVAPTTDVALVDPSPAWEEAMLRAMRQVVPGLDDALLFVDRFSVGFLERWIGKEFGPAVSTGQTPDQVGARRPPVRTPVRGLYVAGCGAGGRGVGTELAAASAMECVDRILADLGRSIPVAPAVRRAVPAARVAMAGVAAMTRPRGRPARPAAR